MNSPSTPDGASIDECVAFIRELMDNAQTIADTKNGDDRAGWLDDARLHAAVLSFLARSESRLGQWTPVAVGQLPSGAEDVLTWTITGHCDSAHPHRIRALHAEAQQTGEECFYTHWMPKPGGPK